MVLVTVFAGLNISAPKLNEGTKGMVEEHRTTNHRTWSSVGNSVCLPMTRQSSVETIVFAQI